MADNNQVVMKQLFDMPLLSIWKPNDTDLIVRCPGGWVFTVNKIPVFIPEPGQESYHNYKAVLDEILQLKTEKTADEEEDDMSEIDQKLEELENEIKKNKSVCSESLHPTECEECDGCEATDESEAYGCDESDSEVHDETS